MGGWTRYWATGELKGEMWGVGHAMVKMLSRESWVKRLIKKRFIFGVAGHPMP